MTDEEKKLRAKAAMKRFCEKHRAERAQKCREWRKNNPDKAKHCVAKWREANLERELATKRKWYRNTDGAYLSSAYSWNDVEGYDGWTVNTVVHHRLEMFGFSVEDLVAQGRYYDCTPDELICMSLREHNALHTYLRAITRKNP